MSDAVEWFKAVGGFVLGVGQLVMMGALLLFFAQWLTNLTKKGGRRSGMLDPVRGLWCRHRVKAWGRTDTGRHAWVCAACGRDIGGSRPGKRGWS